MAVIPSVYETMASAECEGGERGGGGKKGEMLMAIGHQIEVLWC